MNKYRLFTGFVFFVLLIAACQSPKGDQTTSYQLDHFIIFVQDSSIRQQLHQILTPAEALTTVHKNQGTRGEYFLFLNSFVELLYLEDTMHARQNEALFKSAYTNRWLVPEYPLAQLGFGLKMRPFDSSKVDFEVYASKDSPKDEYYLMAAGNTNLQQPLLFITHPKHEQEIFASLEDARTKVRPEIREDLLRYLSHPGGLQKITAIKFYLPPALLNDNIKLLQQMKNCIVIEANQPQLIIEFDEHQQQKTIQLSDFLKFEY